MFMSSRLACLDCCPLPRYVDSYEYWYARDRSLSLVDDFFFSRLFFGKLSPAFFEELVLSFCCLESKIVTMLMLLVHIQFQYED